MVFALPALLFGRDAESQRPADATTAFVHVNVVSMTRPDVMLDQTVVVAAGVVREIGPSAQTAIPRDAERIDASGRYLMPGLADLHVHFDAPVEFLNALYYGVTTVTHLSGVPPELDAFLKSPTGLHPRVFTTGTTTDGFPPLNRRFVAVESAAEAEAMVADQVAHGAQFIKVYSNYSVPAFQAVVAAAKRHHIVVIGHIPLAVGAMGVLQGGQRMIAHGEEFWSTYFGGKTDTAGMGRLIAEVKRVGAYVTPNLSAYANMLRVNTNISDVLRDPDIRFLGVGSYHEWLPPNNRYGPARRPPGFASAIRGGLTFLGVLTKALSVANVPLLLGTDAPVIGFPGEAAHVELEELQRAGLTPFEALRTGTSTAGRFLRETVPGTPVSGVVAPGAVADLVLLQSNPLVDVANARSIVGVMIGGRWLPRQRLEQLRDSAAAPLVPLRAAAETVDRDLKAGNVPAARAVFDSVQHSGYDEASLGPWLMDNVLISTALGLARNGSAHAVDVAQMNLALHSRVFWSYNVLGEVQLALGDTVAAHASYSAAVRLAPYDATARHGVARTTSGR